VIGCVVYPATELVSHGVIRHVEGNRFPVGEPDGTASDRVQRVAECLTRAGFKAPVLDDIRAEIWLKLGQHDIQPDQRPDTLDTRGICQYPPSRELAAAMMTEAQISRTGSGSPFACRWKSALRAREKVGHHKHPCCRMSKAAVTSRLMRCWVPSWSSLA